MEVLKRLSHPPSLSLSVSLSVSGQVWAVFSSLLRQEIAAVVALPMLEWSECLLPTQKIVPARSIAVSYLWTPVARNVTGYVTCNSQHSRGSCFTC